LKSKAVTVLFLNDIHTGAKSALWPKGFPSHTGNVPGMNRLQRYLHEHWKEFTQAWLPSKLPQTGPVWNRKAGKLDYLVLNGDLVDGDQWRRGGVGVVDPDPLQQARAAVELLAPVREMCKKSYLVSGTDYHTGNYRVWSRYLGEALDCEPFGDDGGASAPTNYAIPWLCGPLSNGVRVDIAHTQSVMLRYRSSPLEREMQFSAMLPDAVKAGPTDLFVRAHTHAYHLVVEETGVHALALAGWQCIYDYLSGGKVPNRAVVTLGSTLLTLEPRELGKAWCHIDSYHFPHPQIAQETL
jgi:hypothetical protein